MQITQVQVGNLLYPLIEGQPLPIEAGETIRVFFTFRGRVPQETEVRVWASLYQYVLGILNREEKAQTKATTILEGTVEFVDYERAADIVIGDIGSGLYGIIIELKDYDVSDRIDDCLEVAKVPSIWDMLPSLIGIGLMVFMMSMITPMMKEGAE